MYPESMKKNQPDRYVIDVTQETCPMTFVRVALSLAPLQSGEIAEIRLRDGEPTQNVRRSLIAHGHKILETHSLAGEAAGLNLLVVSRK
jgi:tRNA 2-thiouridine synthesizing protein A